MDDPQHCKRVARIDLRITDTKEIISYLKPYRSKLFLAIAVIALSTFCNLMLPMIMSSIVNDGVSNADFRDDIDFENVTFRYDDADEPAHRFIDNTPVGEILHRMTGGVSRMGTTVHSILDTIMSGFLQIIAFANSIAYILINLLGGWLIVYRDVDVGTVMTIILFARQIVSPLEQIATGTESRHCRSHRCRKHHYR